MCRFLKQFLSKFSHYPLHPESRISLGYRISTEAFNILTLASWLPPFAQQCHSSTMHGNSALFFQLYSFREIVILKHAVKLEQEQEREFFCDYPKPFVVCRKLILVYPRAGREERVHRGAPPSHLPRDLMVRTSTEVNQKYLLAPAFMRDGSIYPHKHILFLPRYINLIGNGGSEG